MSAVCQYSTITLGILILNNKVNVFFLVELEYDLFAELLCLSTILKAEAKTNFYDRLNIVLVSIAASLL
jgi:hypothetical protein